MPNKIVEEQVQKHFGGAQIPSASMEAFIKSISKSFDDCVDKIKKLETTIENCANQRKGLVDKLQNETAGLTIAHKELSRIFNQVNEGFFSKDIIAGKYIHMSVGCEKIYGYTVPDFYANSLLWFQVIHPDDRYLIDKENEELEKGNQTVSAYRIIRKDTTIKWIEVKAIPEIIDGRLSKVEGVVNDITERKNAEKLLMDSEVKYRSFFENNLDGVLLSRPDGAIEEANPAACQIFRATEQEICSYNRAALLNFAAPGILNLLEERKRNGKVKGEGDFMRLDGSTFNAEISSSIFKDKNGEERAFIIIRDITERKQAEAALLLNERQLNLIYNNVNDGIFMLSIENENRYKFISVNHSFLRLTGLTNKQVVGKYANELIPSPSVEMVLQKYRQAINGKKTINWEEQSNYPSGLKSALVSINPVMDKCGNCIRIIGSVHDITKRKKVEEAIKKSEQKFHNLVNTVNGIVWEADPATLQFTFVSKRAEALLGYPVAEWIDSPDFWKSHIHPDDRDAALAFCIQCIGDKRSHDFEYRMIAADGNVFWLQDFVSIIANEDQSLYLRGIMIDITARKKSEQQIMDSEQRYRQIVETAQEGIWLVDENNLTTFVNKKMSEIIGYPPDEIMGKPLFHFLDVDGGKIAKPGLENSSLAISGTLDFRFITKSGKAVWTSLSNKPIFDSAGIFKGALAMITDITQRKMDESLLKISEASLDLKNKELKRKNTELEQFAYVASHDLQEPLRTATSFVQLLQKQYQGKLDEKADKYLNFIIDSSDRMKVLINDLLDYSRIGRKKQLELVNCNNILRDVIADLQVAISDNAAKIISGNLPVINGYPTEIKQLFQNLLTNAMKFSKPTVTPQIKISATLTGGYWNFAFEDNGIGINKSHFERIFIIFQRLHTRTEYQGSGIGLSHCKKIVELHHGKIWVGSIPGEGSIFNFTIPENDSL